jgi:hypothetical protein
MKSYIQKIGSTCIALILLASTPYASVWARGGGGGHGGGGHGGGGHFGGGHGGGGHWGGGHWGGHHRGWGYAPYGLGLGLGLGYGLGYYGGYGWGWGGPYYGWGWGGPYYGWGWGGGYYSPGYYGYSSAAVPMAPPVYVQRQDIEPSAPQSTNYWYYCRNPEGYYPYVKECAEGWLQVAPQPSAQQ